MSYGRVGVLVVLVPLVMLIAHSGAAQDLEYETTVDFAFVQRVPLEGKAGEVEIRGVEFVSGKSSGGLMKKTFSSDDPDLQAGITIRLECATQAETKWNIKIAVEFLDADGNVIDRARDKASLKSEAKIVTIQHTTLKWAVQHIKKARLIVEASGKS
jgi:hypothetical protein